MQHYI